MENLYERIKEQTEKKNIKGNDLATLLGLKKSPLTDWKNGKSKPTLEQFEKMCEIFAVSTAWLLLGKEAAELTPNEQELIELYRNTNDIGQPLITNHAKDIQKALPRQQEIKPEIISSDSKIG